MQILNTQTVTTQFNTSSTTFQGSGGTFKMEVPQSSITLVKPVSYEFRVAEYEDSHGDVVRIGLQVQVIEHDNYGAGMGVVKEPWTDVPRVRLPFNG